MKRYAAKQSNRAPALPTCRQLPYASTAGVPDTIAHHYQDPPLRALASFSINREQCSKHPTSQESHSSLLLNTVLVIPIFHAESHTELPKLLPQQCFPPAHVTSVRVTILTEAHQQLTSIIQERDQHCFNPGNLYSRIPPPNQNKMSIQTGGKQPQPFLTPILLEAIKIKYLKEAALALTRNHKKEL